MTGRVLAVAAHPDDIEFMMAGTLSLLTDRGWQAHCIALANGSLGTVSQVPEDIVMERAREAAGAAAVLGATWHPSLVDDGEVIYSMGLVRRVAAVVREVGPAIMLTHAPDDYMDEHVEAARIAVSAAFYRAMPHLVSSPPVPARDRDVTVYHAQPHGLHDQLRRLVHPGIYVDISSVRERKHAALAEHRTQDRWLRGSQGMSSTAAAMEEMARAVGRMSGRYELAEGWRRHSHLGFSAEDADPLTEALGDRAAIDAEYESLLRRRPTVGS